MTLTSIPVKTPDGLAELQERKRGLSQRHRTVLLLVDGKRPLIEVQTMALQAGAPQSCVEDLLTLGLIVLSHPTVPVTRYSEAQSSDWQQPDIWLPSVSPQAASPVDSVERASPTALPASSTSTSTSAESPHLRDLATDSANGDSAGELLSTALTSSPTISTSPLFPSPLPVADDAAEVLENTLEKAREILMRAVRQEAPLAGTLTLRRLRKARTADELSALLDEVEARISKPRRSLVAQQTLMRVRQLLSGEYEPSPPTF